MLYAIVAMLVIILDQWVKLYVSTSQTFPAEGVSLIPGVLRLVDVKNDGAAFGFLSGSNATIWFIVIAGIFTVLVILALATRFINGTVARWSIVLVTAGGVSNCMDRVINFRPTGYVQDMFQFEFAPWFPVFNIADMFITVFSIVFILAILFGRDKKADDDGYELADDEEEEDEPLDTEEEEDPAPRRSRKAASRRKARAVEDEEEEEDEDDAPPARKSGRSSRKARQAKYDAEYEAYRAKREAEARREEEAPAPVEAPAVEEAPRPAAASASDPFAEWERANAARQAAKAPAQSAPVRPAASAQAVRSDRSALAADPQFTAPAAQAKVAAPVETAAPVAPAEPARRSSRPAAKPSPVEEPEESFSLDDILAEFK